MIIRPAKERSAVRLDSIEKLAPNFAGHLIKVFDEYAANMDKWTWAPCTLHAALSEVVSSFETIMGGLSPTHKDAFVKEGMDALQREDVWAHAEASVFHCYWGADVRIRRIRRGLLILNAMRRDNPNILYPSTIDLGSSKGTLTDLYRVSASFMLEYKKLLLKIMSDPYVECSAVRVMERSHALLNRLLNDSKTRHLIRDEGFAAFANHSELSAKVAKYKSGSAHNSQLCRNSFYTVLATYNPSFWAEKKVTMNGRDIILTRLFRMSEPLYNDLAKFVEIYPVLSITDAAGSTHWQYVQKVQKMMLCLLKKLPVDGSEALKSKGFIAFIEDDCKIMLAANALSKYRDFWMIKLVLDTIYPDKQKDWKEILPYHLAFDNQFADRPSYYDFGPIRDISIVLYDDLVKFLEDQKANLDRNPFNANTLSSYFNALKYTLLSFRNEMDEELLIMLRQQGMKALGLPELKLQKAIFAFLQSQWRDKTLKATTAQAMRRTILWFCDQLGFDKTTAFPISASKTEKHLARLNADDYYSAEQCAELVEHVEIMLSSPETSSTGRLQLMLARVILKTAWNLTPTLNIECRDIIEIQDPLNPKLTVRVLLQKARAGYRTDTYDFGGVDSKSISSACDDLICVRDELTAELRASLPDDNPYKKYIFLYERKGKPQRLSESAIGNINYMLKKSGCSLTFDTRKIRKGGVNHLYRKVQKDMAMYEKTAKHGLGTFESNYLRIDPNQARDTLGKGIKVMEDYFMGKEISEDIVIITGIDADMQETPPGACAPSGSSEADRYHLEHMRLHAERKATTLLCANYLACIWCKSFRGVADPEHVWKLLSYQQFVLGDMDASAIIDDVIKYQQEFIETLKDRVKVILSRLDEMTPGVVEEGRVLLRENGMHPDWSFALPYAPMHESKKE